MFVIGHNDSVVVIVIAFIALNTKHFSCRIGSVPNLLYCRFIYREQGDKGLELARTFNYDLIILDLMPLGLSGTEALHFVRRQNDHVAARVDSSRCNYR